MRDLSPMWGPGGCALCSCLLRRVCGTGLAALGLRHWACGTGLAALGLRHWACGTGLAALGLRHWACGTGLAAASLTPGPGPPTGEFPIAVGTKQRTRRC